MAMSTPEQASTMQVTIDVPDEFAQLSLLQQKRLLQDAEMHIEKSIEGPDADLMMAMQEVLVSEKIQALLVRLEESYDPNKEYPNTISI